MVRFLTLTAQASQLERLCFLWLVAQFGLPICAPFFWGAGGATKLSLTELGAVAVRDILPLGISVRPICADKHSVRVPVVHNSPNVYALKVARFVRTEKHSFPSLCVRFATRALERSAGTTNRHTRV